jgi:photoactive yellow protein
MEDPAAARFGDGWVDSPESLRRLVDGLPVGVVVIGPEGHVVAYNRAEAELAGTRPEDVLGRDFFGDVAPCMDVREVAGRVRTALAGEEELDEELEFQFPFDDGALDVRIRIRTIRLGGAPHAVLVIEDNTRLRETERSLEEALDRARELARRDALTRLKNRRAFEERLPTVMAAARRYGFPVSLLVLDIDHFKDVNDRWGHPVGDRVLRVLSGLLGETSRDSDENFRVGGEELAVLAPHTLPPEAELLARRIHRRLEDVEIEEAPELELTVSIGVAGERGADVQAAREAAESLWRRADAAMYRAKEAGRDCTRVDLEGPGGHGDGGAPRRDGGG